MPAAPRNAASRTPHLRLSSGLDALKVALRLAAKSWCAEGQRQHWSLMWTIRKCEILMPWRGIICAPTPLLLSGKVC